MRSLLALLLGLALAACTPTASAPPAGYTGEVILNSGSVPPPHNWRRAARVDGREVTVQDRAKGATEPTTSTRTLTDEDLRRLHELLQDVPKNHREDEGKVGGGYAVIDLRSDGGQHVERQPLAKREGYAVAEQLFAVLAGQ